MIKEVVEQGPFELKKGSNLINGKYRVIGKIGTGHSATVHAISSVKGQRQVIRAIKVESAIVKQKQVKTEIAVLKSIKDSNPDEIGFSNIYQFGYESEFNYMIMSILGPNLQQLLKLCGGTFSLKTTLVIALQLLDRLQVVHNHGYIHGDIAPENCMVGLGPESPFIFLGDFGRCKKFKNKITGQHIGYKEGTNYPFNSTFASINAHNKVQTSRRDDIESLLYMINYIRFGKLPWARNNEGKRNKIDLNTEQLKKKLTPEMLCHKMPLEIIDLVYYVKSIEFYEKPDYDFIRKLLYRCLERESFDSYLAYDWNNLQDVDFKVYSGEPKIVLKGQTTTSERESENVDQSQLEESKQEKQEESQMANLIDT